MAPLKLALLMSLLLVCGARAQDAGDSGQGQGQGLSRDMQKAIHYYQIGDDLEAMNGFMDILTKGDPGERPMANEYLNLVTRRMSSVGGAGGSPSVTPGATTEPVPPTPAPVPAAPSQPPVAVEPTAPATPALPPPTEVAPVSPRPPAVEEMSAANKALMRKEIHSRLHAAQDKSLADLREIDGVRVVMRPNGDPEAIGIPSPLLFQSGISFQRDASKVLDPLTKLVFALGSTQVVILPEGTAIGDAKVLDMRRTMGISSHFYDEGVAPPRVRVNLLNTQVDLPRALLDFKGVVIAFVYDQPMTLSVESAVGDELGPPISLGVFPSQLRPSRNQGAIIEFSVSDPPAGLSSWKFSLLQPSSDGAELAPLQEVIGGGPVFHQIFWNARQNYFGAPLAPGRYECVLTATDAKNRQRALHRWITVLGEAQPEEKLLGTPAEKKLAAAPEVARPAPAPAASAAPGADLPGDASAPLVTGVKPSAEIGAPAPAKPKKQIAKRARRKKPAKAKANPDASDAGSAPGSYKLAFDANTHQLTDAAERALAKAAGTLANYPLESLKVVGHAGADEPDAAALAKDRAQMVFGLLINRYYVDPKKIAMSTADANDGAMVEVIVVRND